MIGGKGDHNARTLEDMVDRMFLSIDDGRDGGIDLQAFFFQIGPRHAGNHIGDFTDCVKYLLIGLGVRLSDHGTDKVTNATLPETDGERTDHVAGNPYDTGYITMGKSGILEIHLAGARLHKSHFFMTSTVPCKKGLMNFTSMGFA